MSKTTILNNISELFTSGKHGILKDAAIVIEDDTIKDIGQANEINKNNSGDVIDLNGKTVTPGLIDPHTHLIFSGTREFELEQKLQGLSYMEILKRGGGINYTVSKTREASKSELRKDALKRLDIMLQHGTTTIEAKSGYGLTVDDEKKILDITNGLDHTVDTVTTFLGAHAVPEEYSLEPEKYIDLLIDEMIPMASERAKFIDVFCERGAFTPEQSKRILQEGKKAGMIPKIHADEFSDTGGARIAYEVDAISADHLLNSSKENLSAMASKGITGVFLPATPFSIMSMKYPDINMIRSTGVNLALATDFNPNCYAPSMLFVISLACYYMKMTPAEAILGSTINAAKAIGIDKYTGSLDIGKKADITVFSVSNHRLIPYSLGINTVSMVMKNGNMVYERAD